MQPRPTQPPLASRKIQLDNDPIHFTENLNNRRNNSETKLTHPISSRQGLWADQLWRHGHEVKCSDKTCGKASIRLAQTKGHPVQAAMRLRQFVDKQAVTLFYSSRGSPKQRSVAVKGCINRLCQCVSLSWINALTKSGSKVVLDPHSVSKIDPSEQKRRNN